METNPLVERVAEAFADDGDLYVSALVEDVTDPNALAAVVALTALGLDDLEEFVNRVGYAAHMHLRSLGHRLPSLTTDEIVRVGLNAAFTATEGTDDARS